MGRNVKWAYRAISQGIQGKQKERITSIPLTVPSGLGSLRLLKIQTYPGMELEWLQESLSFASPTLLPLPPPFSLPASLYTHQTSYTMLFLPSRSLHLKFSLPRTLPSQELLQATTKPLYLRPFQTLTYRVRCFLHYIPIFRNPHSVLILVCPPVSPFRFRIPCGQRPYLICL